MRRRTVQPEIRSFVSVLRSPVTPFDRSDEEYELFRRVQRIYVQRKCELSAIQEGSPRKRCKSLARKIAKLFANTKVHIFERKSAKLIANFSATKVTSLPSHSLSLSLYYREHGSASYIVREVRSVRERDTEREREREIDGSDVTIVVLKLAMSLKINLHFPLPKIRTIGDEFTLSLAKYAPFVSHFTLSHLHFGAEIRNQFTLLVDKKIRPLCFDSLKWREPLDETDLPIEKMNQINTKTYWK